MTTRGRSAEVAKLHNGEVELKEIVDPEIFEDLFSDG